MTDALPLPGVLAEIEEIAGREAAIGVAMHFGGESIHVPRPEKIAPDHPLVLVVGSAAARIAARHAGERIYVPLARRVLVQHLSNLGHDTKEIALRLRISRSTVRQYLRDRVGSMLP